MLDTVELPRRTLILGDKKVIGVKNIRSEEGADISATTGTMSIYDSTETAVVTDAALTMSFTANNKKGRATYGLVTGSGAVDTADTYKAVYKLTFADGSIYQYEQVLEVKTKPF